MAERVQAALGKAGHTLDLDVAQEIVVRACFVRSREEPLPSLHVRASTMHEGGRTLHSLYPSIQSDDERNHTNTGDEPRV